MRIRPVVVAFSLIVLTAWAVVSGVALHHVNGRVTDAARAKPVPVATSGADAQQSAAITDESQEIDQMRSELGQLNRQVATSDDGVSLTDLTQDVSELSEDLNGLCTQLNENDTSGFDPYVCGDVISIP